jgi:hypothetical protein
MAFCYICKKEVDNADFHHVIPQSRGGKKGPRIKLCPTCHTEAHTLALDKNITINNISGLTLNNTSNPRLNKVVLLLKLAQQLTHSAYYKVQLDIPEDVYNILRQEAKDNKVSIPKIIISNLRAWGATKDLIKRG